MPDRRRAGSGRARSAVARQAQPSPDTRALRVFATVAREGGMTAAAAVLGLTQSAVSQAVRQLEDELGVVLVDRTSRPVRLTRAGALLYRRGQPLLDGIAALASHVRSVDPAQLPELRIGLIDSVAATAGPHLIDALMKTTSRLSFLSGLAPAQAEGLLSRQLDMIVTADPMDDVEGLERHPILREPFVLAFAAASPLQGLACDLKALSARGLLVRFSARSLIGAQIESHLRRLGVAAAHRVEVDTAEVQLAMVESGLGWAVTTPLCLVQAGARRRPLRVAPLPGPMLVRHIQLIGRQAEDGDLHRRIARTTRTVFARDVVPELARIAPWVSSGFWTSVDGGS